jgi:hypothetical protein
MSVPMAENSLTSRRRFHRSLAASLAVLALSLGAWSLAHGRVLIRERFESIRPGVPSDNTVVGRDGRRLGFSMKQEGKPFRDTPTAYLDLPVVFDNAAARGAISFDIQRKAGEARIGRRTLFELLDGEGEQLLAFQIQWKSDFDPRFPMFFILGDDYRANGAGLWSQQILVRREVPQGRWIHVDIAWDDGAKQYALYVDGLPQDVSPKYFDAKSRTILPDPRLDRNARAVAAKGRPDPVLARPFGYFLSKARAFRLGVNSHPKRAHAASSFLSQSVLDNFSVLSDEWPSGLEGAPVIASVTDDSFKIPGISGKLVAGQTVTATLVARPGGTASFDMGRVKGIPMPELPVDPGGPGKAPVAPGTYRGAWTIRPGDDFEDGHVVGKFVSNDNVAAEPVASASRWTIVTRPSVTFSIASRELPADSGTKSRIRLTAVDANGNPVAGRNLKLTLSTTGEYTGTVGAGDFGKQVGASVEQRWKGSTDAWGQVEFDYVAGFAAKTVILQAKDLDSGGVSVDYITSYKEAPIDIALTAPRSMAAARRGMQYAIRVEASRTELTADGKSRSVIRATVTDPGGKAVPGDPVAFALSSPNGSLRTIVGVTDARGVATAEYIAGKRIGVVSISATDTVRNVSGNVSILLLADAPARIILKASPDSLPADGNSRADIHVRVTDINDNPNRDAKVEFKISRGAGRLEYPDRTTDKSGDALNRFTAGTIPGIATVLATVRSKVPTAAELLKAKNVLFVPYNPSSEGIRIEKWLKKKGEAALRGEPIVSYTVGRAPEIRTIDAPYDLKMGETLVEYWDIAEVGQTLATVVPAVE